MSTIRLNKETAVHTPTSGTTILINYSAKHHILEVEFNGGRVYQYKNVELSKWKEYQSVVAEGGSSGTFVNKNIKPFYTAEEIL